MEDNSNARLKKLIDEFKLVNISNQDSKRKKYCYAAKDIRQVTEMAESHGGLDYHYFYRRMSIDECENWMRVKDAVKAGDYSVLEVLNPYCINTGLMWAGNFNYCKKIHDKDRHIIMEISAPLFTKCIQKYGFVGGKSECGTFSFSIGTKSSNSYKPSGKNVIRNIEDDFAKYLRENKIMSCFIDGFGKILEQNQQAQAKAMLPTIFVESIQEIRVVYAESDIKL